MIQPNLVVRVVQLDLMGEPTSPALPECTELKVCAQCGVELPLEAFYLEPKNSDGRKGSCKRCYKSQVRGRYHKMDGKTYDQLVADLYQAQGGLCKLCRRPMPSSGGDCHLDHCHDTDMFRGLLHRKCNTGLGSFDDDPERLRAAAAYIEASRRERLRGAA